MSLARAREVAVLSLLAAHPAHGYEIAKAVSSGPLAALGLSRPAVYAILDRFGARGWVEEHPEPGGSYPDRTVLSLTGAGRAALDGMIARFGSEPLPATVPLIAFTMSLDGGAAVPKEALDKLIAARRRQLESWPDDPGHAASASQRLARRVVEAEIALLEELRAAPGK